MPTRTPELYIQYNSIHTYILYILALLLLFLLLLFLLVLLLSFLIFLFFLLSLSLLFLLLYICVYICNLLKPRYMKHILNMEKGLSSKPDPAIQRSCGLHLQEQLPQVLPAGRGPCRWWVRPGKSPGCRPVKRWPPTADVSDHPTKWCIAGPPFSPIPETKGRPGGEI